jgi:hypothetical protein
VQLQTPLTRLILQQTFRGARAPRRSLPRWRRRASTRPRALASSPARDAHSAASRRLSSRCSSRPQPSTRATTRARQMGVFYRTKAHAVLQAGWVRRFWANGCVVMQDLIKSLCRAGNSCPCSPPRLSLFACARPSISKTRAARPTPTRHAPQTASSDARTSSRAASARLAASRP